MVKNIFLLMGKKSFLDTVLGGENLLNVSAFYNVPLSENVILPFTVICHLLKDKKIKR